MANDGTLNQNESGVGIFDELTFQNDTPIAGESEQVAPPEKEVMTDAEAEQLIADQAQSTESEGMMFGFTSAENQRAMTEEVEGERTQGIHRAVEQQAETEDQAEAE